MAKKKTAKNKGQNQQLLSPEKFLQQKARSLEIGKCWLTDDLKTYGEGYVIVSRNHVSGKVSFAVYLIDAYCLGVKDSFFKLRAEDYELRDMLMAMGDRLCACSYEEAHNWVYGAVAFAEEAGIKPHKTFALTRYLLEEDTDDVPLIEYEFGKDGQHFLVAHSNLEASRYLPLLRKNLGDNFQYVIEDDEDDDDDDWLDEDEEMDFMERWSGLEDHPMLKKYGPDTEYTYKHPDYPKTLELNTPWLQDELCNPENSIALSDKLTKRILDLPHEPLREDLERLIYYYIGQTCDGIPDGFCVDGYNGVIALSVRLLAEVGNDDSSLDAVLEVMRQSEDFYDYHICDSGQELLVPTLYKLGQHRLDKLKAFVKEEGLYTFGKCHVFPTVVQIAIRQPERREEAVEWFRDILRFAAERIAETQYFDSTLAGLLIGEMVDFQAIELLPEIKALYETGLVNIGSCGTYESVERDIRKPLYMRALEDECILDIYKWFADQQQRFG